MCIHNNSENVYLKIKEMILSGEFRSDEKINQLALANKLGVSRTPVVKALYRLTSEGFIENIPNRGFFVIEYTIAELIDLLVIRQAFDRVLAENLIPQITEKEISTLRSFFAPFINCKWTDENIKKYWDVDKEFHEFLVKLCRNKWVEKINDSFDIYGRVNRGGLVRLPRETLPEHLNIINAIEKRDLNLVVSELNKHIQSSIDVLDNTQKTLGEIRHKK